MVLVLDIISVVTPYLSIEDLLTVLTTSKGALRTLSEQGTFEMLRTRFHHAFSNAEIEEHVPDNEMENGLSLIRGLSTFYQSYEKALCSIGSSKGLRIDTIFENAELFEKVSDETELFDHILQRKKARNCEPRVLPYCGKELLSS